MKPLTTGARLFLALIGLLGAVSFADFLFHGHRITDLLIGLGFALMAYGVVKNGLRRPGDAGTPAPHRNAAIASGIGTALVLGSIVAGWVR